MSDITVTLVNAASGQSETLPLPATMTIKDVIGLAKAILGLENSRVALFKDGKGLSPTSMTLQAAGVKNGDLLAAQAKQQAPAPAPAAASGGLDFSSLLGGVGSAPAPSTLSSNPSVPNRPPMYYPGMSVEDAMQHNPHPNNFVALLQQHEHLFKELRYHNPQLATKLQNQPLERAVQIWREEMVKGSIARAVKTSQTTLKRQEMQGRLDRNPNDAEAKEYFADIEKKRKIDEQYYTMMESYPESLGRILMLYVEAKINSHPIQAFVDSGAQMTIMSKKVAQQCGLFDLIDTRFAGVAAGVGTGKILGKVHIVQLQIGDSYFPCSVSVMDSPADGATEMPFLLGLDMLKRHQVCIDCAKGVLRFTGGKEIPFLHEKDLEESQGGTRGFNADKANEELQKLQEKDGEDRDKAMDTDLL